MKCSCGVHRSNQAFTLIELLAVIAIVAILAAILFPMMARATLRAKVARVHSDLRQVGTAVDLYTEDCAGLPPVRSCCTGSPKLDYYELPRELTDLRYLATHRMHDPFNRTRGDDDQLGRTYKYTAINWGYSNGLVSGFSMWIPRDYPRCAETCALYYKNAGRIYVFDKGRTYPKKPPISWAIWSVGPAGDPGQEETGLRSLPMPRKHWYPASETGVIARFSDGRGTP